MTDDTVTKIGNGSANPSQSQPIAASQSARVIFAEAEPENDTQALLGMALELVNLALTCPRNNPPQAWFDALIQSAEALELKLQKAVPVRGVCCARLNGLMFDAMGQPRTRYVRVSLDGNHCVMHKSEGDTYLQDARDCCDENEYTVADVYLSEREFEDLPDHDGF